MNNAFWNSLLRVPLRRSNAPLRGRIGTAATGVGIGTGCAGQLQQVRRHAPICGPPRFPMSTGKKFLLGFLPLVLMLVLPYYCLFQMPRWSAAHNNRPYAYDEERRQRQEAEQEA